MWQRQRLVEKSSNKYTFLDHGNLYFQVANLVARWRLVQPLVSDLLPTDLRPSDSYLVLAAHLLWDLWSTTGSSKHFLRATTILQMGVTSSPSNWQMKLLLIRLYNRYLFQVGLFDQF